MRFLPAVATAVFLFFAVSAGPGLAQAPLGDPGGAMTAGTAPDPEVSAADIEELIATLEQDGARRELVAQLRALAEARRAAEGDEEDVSGGDGILSVLTDRFTELSQEIINSAELAAQVPRVVPWAERTFGNPETRNRWIVAALKLLAVVVAGFVAEAIAKALLARPRRALEERENQEISVRAISLVARTVLEFVPIGAFALAAGLVLPLVEPSRATGDAAFAIIEANVIARLVLVMARAVLAPRVERLRLLRIESANANYAYVWIRRFTNVGIYGFFLIEAAHLLGLPSDGHLVLLKLLGLVLTAMGIALVLQLRRPLADLIAGRQDEPRTATTVLRRRAADVWHVLAIVYLIALFCIWLLDVRGGFFFIARASVLTIVILVAGRLLQTWLQRGLRRMLAVRDDVRERHPELEERAGKYLAVVYGTVRAIVWLVAAILVAEAWGLDSFGWIASETGRDVIGAAVRIAIVLIGAVLLLEFVSSSIERYLERNQVSDPSPDRATRLRTLLPLARNALWVLTTVIVTLIVLSQLGLNIAPLLAGAGVVGLAIGFGSQKLVQDVINGVFQLIEDTVQVGDVVQVAGHIGRCEAISIRTITLRDLSGTVHTIPFSEVTTIENLTKEFSYALMEVGVAYREDTDAVIEILREVAEEMAEDGDFANVMLEPLEVLGVDEFADSAVIIKVRIKTLPIKQWMVKREFNRRMKKAFDAAGIEIPFPHTTLYFGEDKEGNAPPAFVELLSGDARRERAQSGPTDEPGERSAERDGEAESDSADAGTDDPTKATSSDQP